MNHFKPLIPFAVLLWLLPGIITVNSAMADAFPYELTRDDDVPLISAASWLGFAAISIQSDMPGLSPDELARLDSRQVNRFDRSATRHWSGRANTASNWLERLLLPLPALLALSDRGQDEPVTTLTMYGETVLLTNTTIQLLKGTIRRTRPYAYNTSPQISTRLKQNKKTRRSFPSGHAANTFAAAVFTGSLFEQMYPRSNYRPLVWSGVLAAAAMTGYLRYTAGRHYPTDIIVGAAIGAAIGYFVSKIHEANLSDHSTFKTVPILNFRFTF